MPVIDISFEPFVFQVKLCFFLFPFLPPSLSISPTPSPSLSFFLEGVNGSAYPLISAVEESVWAVDGTQLSASGALESPSNSDKAAGWHGALVALEQLAEPGSYPSGQATLPYQHPHLGWPGLLLKGAFVYGFQGQSPSISLLHS